MKIIILLSIYLPFEEFFLKWLPVSDFTYFLLRQMPDAIVFSLSLILLLTKLSSAKNIPVVGYKADAFLFLFVVWAFVTLILNHAADTVVGLANIKALLRYVLLIYIVLMLNPSEKQIDRLVRWLLLSVACQSLIGFSQFIGGIPVRDFLAARHVSESIGGIIIGFTGDRFEGINDLMGTMGNTISFAYFLLLGLVIWFFSSRFGSLKYWLGIMALFVLIYLSGSRSVTIAAFLLIVYHQIWVKGWRRTTKSIIALSVLLVPAGLVVLSSGMLSGTEDNNSFWFMFSGDYLEAALNQRLGIVVYVVPNILFGIHNIIGFSPDENFLADYIANNLPMVPQVLIHVLPYVIEDIYWVAMYAYYGLIGFVFWLFFLVCLHKNIYRSISVAASTVNYRLRGVALFLLLASVPLNFLNQAFESRAFSFYLWLFCGLTLASFRSEERNVVRKVLV